MLGCISRRHFLGALVAASALGCARQFQPLELAPASSPTMPCRALKPLSDSPQAQGPPSLIPIVDFHTHLQKRITAEDLVRRMDEVLVARMVLMPLYYGDTPRATNDGEGSDEQALAYARRYPERFIPFVGMQRPELVDHGIWQRPTSFVRRLVRETDAKLRTGEFFGMGEFMLRFYPYTNKFGIVAPSDMDYPADSYLMRTFADLSARYKVPMVVHAEAEPPVTDAMIRLLEAHPDAILVWAHNCGRSNAQSIAAMLGRFPNLHADLGGMVYSGSGVEHYGVYFPRRTPWMHLVVDESGRLLPEMKSLFETYPDRFFTGTDIAHARVYERYVQHLPRWRFIFQQLSAGTARKIAYGNADRLFSLGGGGT
jgi:hypothetical protein